jgi:hypothetical protein
VAGKGMLISKEVEVRLFGRIIKYYKNLGYDIPMYQSKDGMRIKNGTILKVKIEDVSQDSHVMVLIKCDYCTKQYLTRYDGYNKRKENDIALDCCDECKSIKNTELNMLRYGVENQFQRQEIKDKIANIILDKYGVTHPMKVPEIQQKAMQNMSDKNGIECSTQQKYLHNLLGGKLNFVDSSTKGFAIDIAFPDQKIALEYAGSGHALQVKFKNMTESEFKRKEIIRYLILKQNGWKQIHINSKYDYLPVDDVIISEIKNAIEWFKSDETGHYHYNIDVGKPKDTFMYGKLRKVKQIDVMKEVG